MQETEKSYIVLHLVSGKQKTLEFDSSQNDVRVIEGAHKFLEDRTTAYEFDVSLKEVYSW